MMQNISVRLESQFMKEVGKLANLEKVDNSFVIRQALEKGLAEIKLNTALELFSKGKIATSEAADIADISVGEFMDEAVKRGIKSGITLEDLKGSLKIAMKSVK
ncbi:UPF0175 family protein [Candidatus Woesearchaeota archaeon]|nr:UPF0175 family protein [Candidatus Woesearchaeota archaeon]